VPSQISGEPFLVSVFSFIGHKVPEQATKVLGLVVQWDLFCKRVREIGVGLVWVRVDSGFDGLLHEKP